MQRYNLQLLDEHRLTVDRITGEQACKHAVTAMFVADTGIMDVQWAVLDSMRGAGESNLRNNFGG